MKPRILVIEDNATNIELMRYLLVAHGCEVTVATSGMKGLQQLESVSFDLVICDIAMPGIDGYGVLQRARENSKLAELPFVAVTAFAMDEDRDRIMKAGFDGYLTKPITPKTFAVEVLQYLLPRQNRAHPGGTGNGKHSDR